jgi:hypothetical protein
MQSATNLNVNTMDNQEGMEDFEFVAEPERLDSYLNNSFSDSDSSDGDSSSSSSDGEFDDSFDTDDDEHEYHEENESFASIERLSAGTQEEEHPDTEYFGNQPIFGHLFLCMPSDQPPHNVYYHHQVLTASSMLALSMYTESVSHARRRRHANYLLQTYPTQVPIDCRSAPHCTLLTASALLSERMLVPGSLSVNQFCHVLKRKVSFLLLVFQDIFDKCILPRVQF